MGNFSFSVININASKYFDVDKITTKREKNIEAEYLQNTGRRRGIVERESLIKSSFELPCAFIHFTQQ